jgi:hypothetical protein
MAIYFDGMPSPSEMATYMTWRPPSIPPVRGRPGSFDVVNATLGALTPRTGGSMPLDWATPRDSPCPMFVKRHAHRRRLSTELTARTPVPTLPPSRPRIDAGVLISRPQIDVGQSLTSWLGTSPLLGPSSRGASLVSASQGRSSPASSSGRASPSGPS